jgi:hypothetical protein
MPVWKAVLSALTTAIVAACSSPQPEHQEQLARMAAACGLAEGVRGTPTDFEALGQLDELTGPRLGVVFASDSSVFGLMAEEAQLVRWRFGATTRSQRIGRSGKGPGEFQQLGRGAGGRPVHWVDRRGDTLYVYDGLRLQRFDMAGRYLSEDRRILEAHRAPPFGMKTRMRVSPFGTLIDAEALSFLPPYTRAFVVWRYRGDSVEKAAALDLAALPRLRSAAWSGPLEARALWDVAGRCAVLSDGASGILRYARLDIASPLDSVTISLPERPAATFTIPPEEARRIGFPSDAPPPSRPRTIRQMLIDPARRIWLLGNQPGGALDGVEVVRVDPLAASVVIDTTPAFPIAFGPNGTAMGVVNDADGLMRFVWLRGAGKR